MSNNYTSALGGGGGGSDLYDITVNCSPDLAGETITCSDGTTDLTQTCPSESPYIVQFTNLATGLYTISGVINGTTISIQVNASNTITVDLKVEGFDWREWVDLSKNYKANNYDSLSEVLSDEKLIRELMTIHDCVDYLADQNFASSDAITILNTGLCAKWINLRDYALDTLYANPAYSIIMDETELYFYGELELKGMVPVMTSNTTPLGVAFANSERTSEGMYAWRAFQSGLSSTSNYDSWATDSNIPGTTENYIGYQFTAPVCICAVGMSARYNMLFNYPTSWKLQASNDGSTWVDISDVITETQPTAVVTKVTPIHNAKKYTYYRVYTYGQFQDRTAIGRLSFMAYQPKGAVPVMTSNSAPYGTVIYSDSQSGNDVWHIFDENESDYGGGSNASMYMGYKFVNPIKVKKAELLTFRDGNSQTSYQIKIQASNDNTNWDDVTNVITINNITDKTSQIIVCDENAYYLYYRVLFVTSSNTSSYSFLRKLQFYGRQLSASVPIMTSNTAPYGEAGVINTPWHGQAYNAFDKVNNNHLGGGENKNYLGVYYKFTHPVCVREATILPSSYTSNGGFKAFKIQASNDNINYVDLYKGVHDNAGYTEVTVNFTNTTSYTYYRFYAYDGTHDTTRYTPNISELQFYGVDYSEREFASGSTMKYLYDHGLELVAFDDSLPTGCTITREPSQIDVSSTQNAQSSGILPGVITHESIDITPYSGLNMRLGNKNYTNADTKDHWLRMTVSNSLGYNDSDVSASRKVYTPYENPYFLDVSSVNQNRKIGIWNHGNGGKEVFGSFKELWLE
jgi:hypothetical protein